jgi:hypothetical protein
MKTKKSKKTEAPITAPVVVADTPVVVTETVTAPVAVETPVVETPAPKTKVTKAKVPKVAAVAAVEPIIVPTIVKEELDVGEPKVTAVAEVAKKPKAPKAPKKAAPVQVQRFSSEFAPSNYLVNELEEESEKE